MSTPLITSTTPTAVVSGAALLSTKVASTVAVTNKPTSDIAVTDKPASDMAVTKVEDVVPLNEAVDKVIPLATEAVVVNQVVSNSIEPTSTMPIAATRDVPLPEALPEEVETEVIAVAAVSNEFELVDTQEIVHTVVPGENLYSISVEYNVKLNTLRKWNDISEKNKIRIGDKLYVVDPQTVKNIND